MISGASAEKTQQLGMTAQLGMELSGGVFNSYTWWSMLTVSWDLSWGCQLEHLQMAFLA